MRRRDRWAAPTAERAPDVESLEVRLGQIRESLFGDPPSAYALVRQQAVRRRNVRAIAWDVSAETPPDDVTPR
jgi:hypothetical protein